jgi:hypothetical protein
MADVLSFAKVLAKGPGGPPSRAFALRNVSRSYCSTRKVTYGAWRPNKMARHRRSSNWARTSASFAASTGSRDRAEQRHVLSQEEAAGSPSTAVISGCSPEFVGSLGRLTLRHLHYSNQRQVLAWFQASWQSPAAAANDSGDSLRSIRRP